MMGLKGNWGTLECESDPSVRFSIDESDKVALRNLMVRVGIELFNRA